MLAMGVLSSGVTALRKESWRSLRRTSRTRKIVLRTTAATRMAKKMMPRTRSARWPALCMVVTIADSGRVVNLKRGDTFEVRLESNPSTGYDWTVSHEKNDIVRKKSMKFMRGGAGDMPGTGGMDVWKFEAVKAGNQRLT